MSQVKELDGNWAAVEIYRSKKNPDDVVLFFGGDEYEGLEGGYRYAKGPDNRMVLKDSDGGVIELRGRPSSKKRKLQSKQPKQLRMRPSNKYVGVYENVEKHTWVAKVVQGKGRTSVLQCKSEKAAAAAYDKCLGRPVNFKTLRAQPKAPASLLRGVSWAAQSMQWRAVIEVEGESRIIGLFPSEREAAQAYDREARQERMTEFNFRPADATTEDPSTASYVVGRDPLLITPLIY